MTSKSSPGKTLSVIVDGVETTALLQPGEDPQAAAVSFSRAHGITNEADITLLEHALRGLDTPPEALSQKPSSRSVEDIAADMLVEAGTLHDPADPNSVLVDLVANGHAAPLVFHPFHARGKATLGGTSESSQTVWETVGGIETRLSSSHDIHNEGHQLDLEVNAAAKAWCKAFGSVQAEHIAFVEAEVRKAWDATRPRRSQKRIGDEEGTGTVSMSTEGEVVSGTNGRQTTSSKDKNVLNITSVLAPELEMGTIVVRVKVDPQLPLLDVTAGSSALELSKNWCKTHGLGPSHVFIVASKVREAYTMQMEIGRTNTEMPQTRTSLRHTAAYRRDLITVFFIAVFFLFGCGFILRKSWTRKRSAPSDKGGKYSCLLRRIRTRKNDSAGGRKGCHARSVEKNDDCRNEKTTWQWLRELLPWKSGVKIESPASPKNRPRDGNRDEASSDCKITVETTWKDSLFLVLRPTADSIVKVALDVALRWWSLPAERIIGTLSVPKTTISDKQIPALSSSTTGDTNNMDGCTSGDRGRAPPDEGGDLKGVGNPCECQDLEVRKSGRKTRMLGADVEHNKKSDGLQEERTGVTEQKASVTCDPETPDSNRQENISGGNGVKLRKTWNEVMLEALASDPENRFSQAALLSKVGKVLGKTKGFEIETHEACDWARLVKNRKDDVLVGGVRFAILSREEGAIITSSKEFARKIVGCETKSGTVVLGEYTDLSKTEAREAVSWFVQLVATTPGH